MEDEEDFWRQRCVLVNSAVSDPAAFSSVSYTNTHTDLTHMQLKLHSSFSPTQNISMTWKKGFEMSITLFCSKPPHTWCQQLGERCRCLLLSKHVSDRAPQLLEESTHCFYPSHHITWHHNITWSQDVKGELRSPDDSVIHASQHLMKPSAAAAAHVKLSIYSIYIYISFFLFCRNISNLKKRIFTFNCVL